MSGLAAHRLGNTLAGIALVAAGLLLAVAGLRTEPASFGQSGEGYVNTDRPGIDNHNSPAVAADPTRPSVVAVVDRIDAPRFNCTLSLSTNAGVSWRRLQLPLPPEAPNCFWPDVAFDADGRLLVLYTATGGRYNQPVGVWLQRFDGEAAAGPAVAVAGAEAFHAHMAVDGRRVVVAYVQTPPANADRPLGFEPGIHPLMVTRSEDGGAAFSPPSPLPGDARVAHPTVVATGGGSFLVGALDYHDDVENYEARHEGQGGPPPAGVTWRVLAWRSTDGAATFGPPTVVADGLPVPQRVVIDLAPGPSFAADPSRDRVYAAWDAGTGDERDVFVAASVDGGATWGGAGAVEPRSRGQFLPALDVAPDGRVDLVFYDRSGDPEDVLVEARAGSSHDQGRTFATKVVSSHRFDSRIGQGGPQAIPQLGNQLAVLSREDGFLAFWADTTRATPTTADVQVMDLAVATLTPREDGGRSWPLAVAGLGALAVGAALLVVARRR
ncbi:MAG: hypothetical protein ACLGI2_08770 [Acidimicrobiia bacterium]